MRSDEFYFKLPLDELCLKANELGIQDCCDLEVLASIFSGVNHISELGAGYGRVIDFLLTQTDAKIQGYEMVPEYFSFLEQKYSGQKRVNLTHTVLSVKTIEHIVSTDIALLSWGHLIDVQDCNRANYLRELRNRSGMLIIDCPLENGSLGIAQGNVIQIPTKYGLWEGDLLDEKRIYVHAEQANLVLVDRLPYLTLNGRERVQNVFT